MPAWAQTPLLCLLQVCGKPVTTNTGKCLRPPDNSHVILYLKDINLPRCGGNKGIIINH